ncbi:hypothetical protein AGDE_12823 [Angomonas deanei]|uniref:Uncharacterized protein n=1 Tax=Angomonas deanei TaxID=59799 RepID=A0A7G2CG62_9TRYP|nr:hypothetical protein AGDE_12823 [Angomonas deanei]CAD2218878.1 hypothetical protein, conserved [Angomonas deanei]|eukprot:EPY23497.1 hypothetical protein AGDE_12823 [Angomonas deanei]
MRRMVSRLNKVYQERQRSLHTNRHASGIPSGPSTAATEEREAKYLKDKINLVFLFHHFLLKCLQVVSSLHAVRPLASDYYDASATNNNKAFAARNVFLQSNAFFKIQEDSFHYIMHQSLNPIIMYFYNLFEETNQYEFFYNKHYGGDQRRRESELIATIDFNELLPYLFYISNLTSEESGNEDHDNNEDSQRIPDDDDLWDIRHYYGVEECENLYKNKDNISCLAKIKLFEEFKNNYSIHLIKLNSFMDRMEKNYHRDKLEQEEVHKVYEGTRGSDHDDFSPHHQGRMKHEGQETYTALPYSKTKRAGQKKKAVSCGTDCTLM